MSDKPVEYRVDTPEVKPLRNQLEFYLNADPDGQCTIIDKMARDYDCKLSDINYMIDILESRVCD
jgi:hypothetical protein